MHMNRVIWQHMSVNMCLEHMSSVQEEDEWDESGDQAVNGVIINILDGDNRFRQYYRVRTESAGDKDSSDSSSGVASMLTPSPPSPQPPFGLSPPGISKLAQRRLTKARSLTKEAMVG
jgi:hypothetical protein